MGSVNIPLTASTGVTRLRVRCRYNAAPTAIDSCSNLTWGETADYNITITVASPCTNPPTAGTAFASVDSACYGVSFSLALTGNSTGSGQTYQWQSSPDNSTWSNIVGATGTTYSLSQTSATYYRCMVTCGTSVASTGDYVKMKLISQCYCTRVHSTLAALLIILTPCWLSEQPKQSEPAVPAALRNHIPFTCKREHHRYLNGGNNLFAQCYQHR